MNRSTANPMMRMKAKAGKWNGLTLWLEAIHCSLLPCEAGGRTHTYIHIDSVLPSGLPPSWPPVPEVSPLESAPVSSFAHCPPPLAEVTDTSHTHK